MLPAELTFTTSTWDTAVTVTVTGVADADATNETPTVTATASGADYAGKTADVDVTVTDDESAGLVLSRTQLAIDEDGSRDVHAQAGEPAHGHGDGGGELR